MSCPGIPLHTVVTTPCPQVVCQDDSVNPPNYTCVGMKFVFAEKYIRYGYALPHADGAYVPAVTVCQMKIETVPVGRARRSASRYYGL